MVLGRDLDLFIQEQGQETVQPPEGFHRVGHALHLAAEGALRVDGTIANGFEFGDVQLFVAPIHAAEQLRISATGAVRRSFSRS